MKDNETKHFTRFALLRCYDIRAHKDFPQSSFDTLGKHEQLVTQCQTLYTLQLERVKFLFDETHHYHEMKQFLC